VPDSIPLRAALASLLLAAGVGTAGCGTVGKVASGDPSHGKELFQQKCAACHTLADANARGQIGPNLDWAFKDARGQGFDDSTIEDVVRGQIAYADEAPADGSQGMPQNLVTGDDADSVAVYVARVAGKPVQGGGGGGGGSQGGTSGKEIFQSAGCTGCHTLKDAGSTGNVGPNLDQAKPPESLVVDRVTNGKGPMPSFKGQLSDAQIQAVAKYVSSVAGK
jgi:cbb3-type cytochrome c oxidase subunit III